MGQTYISKEEASKALDSYYAVFSYLQELMISKGFIEKDQTVAIDKVVPKAILNDEDIIEKLKEQGLLNFISDKE